MLQGYFIWKDFYCGIGYKYFFIGRRKSFEVYLVYFTLGFVRCFELQGKVQYKCFTKQIIAHHIKTYLQNRILIEFPYSIMMHDL